MVFPRMERCSPPDYIEYARENIKKIKNKNSHNKNLKTREILSLLVGGKVKK